MKKIPPCVPAFGASATSICASRGCEKSTAYFVRTLGSTANGTTGMLPEAHCFRVYPARKLGSVRAQEAPVLRRATALRIHARATAHCCGVIGTEGCLAPSCLIAGPVG